MAQCAVCGLWSDWDPRMDENGDWILIPPSSSPLYEAIQSDTHVVNKRVSWSYTQVANNYNAGFCFILK